MDIDWSKAPEGATHYAPAGKGLNERWFDMTTGELGSVWYEDQWHVINFSASRKDLIAKACAEWTGEGLPPVGTVCEVFDLTPHDCYGEHVGKTVEILAHTAGESGAAVAIYKVDLDGEFHYHGLVAQCFRPIRTPEQIAAEERAKAIDEMAAVYKSNYEGHVKDGCQALYDAGYRKFEIVEGE